jgi:surface protein
MNRLAFQTYGTKKLSLFQSVWDTRLLNPVSVNELAAITGTGTNWTPGGTNLVNGGYNHTSGSAAVLQFSLVPIQGQSYQMKYTVTGTGYVVINFGGVSSAQLFAGTDVIITMTPITAATLSITPLSTFVGNISLSIKQSSSAANQIQLPITVASGKSVWIDWGDGQYSTANSTNIIPNRIHTYTTQGEYPVRVFGDDFIFGFGSGNTNDRLKIKSISSWGKLKMGAESFFNCSNVTMSGITDIPDLTGVTDLNRAFRGCTLITTVNKFADWNTSLVTNFREIFFGCTNFNQDVGALNVSSASNLDSFFMNCTNFNNAGSSSINNWNVSNVGTYGSSGQGIFAGCTKFNQPLGNWNVSNTSIFLNMFNGAVIFNNGFASGVANQLPWNTSSATNMTSMFQNCTAFNSNLGTGTTPWDVSKVTTFSSMFAGASNFNNGDNSAPINDWSINTGSNVTMGNMFNNADAFNRAISNWNMTKVNNTAGMFANANIFNQSLFNWERPGSTMGNVTDMNLMFASSSFNQPIDNWNVSQVRSMNSMFNNATAFNQPLVSWNVGNVTNTAYMFFQAYAFNQPIGSWNVSNVTSMEAMFRGANFNQDISKWNVGKVTTFAQMFWVNSAFNNGDNDQQNPITSIIGINGWNINTTAASVSMIGMFQSATAFNRNIGSWDVSKVTTFANMFQGASNFNNGLASGVAGTMAWNTINATTMTSMFQSASAFNQNIGAWNVFKVNEFGGMFYLASKFNNGESADINNWVLKTTGTVFMYTMFQSAIAFNQPIGNWNTSNVTLMSSMFQGATAFNQDIGSWNVSNVTNFSSFMLGKTNINFSTTNLDAIYNGWSSRAVKPNISIAFGTAKYTAAGTPGKNILIGAPNNWTITDGGI